MTMLFAMSVLAQPALAFDHSHATFGHFLEGAVSNSGVDYDALKSKKSELDAYLKQVADAPASSFSHDEQLAFYVNAYNALTLNLVITENPKSIKDLNGGKVWDERMFSVGRKKMSLNQIEHGHIRKLEDGRIHAVVNCASKGCPPLPPKPLTPTGIQSQLDAAARNWVATNAYEMKGSTALLSKVFNWYGDDFTRLPAGTSSTEDKQKAAVEFIGKYGGDASAATQFEWAPYSWARNSK